MTLLTIDTSTRSCSAALTIGGIPVVSRLSREEGNHAALLPVYIDELLGELRARGLKLDAIVLSEGPGSYTGLRIAASTAKGLCYGLQVPLITLPTPLVLCAAFAATHSGLEDDALLRPMIDARRMEVYTALYDASLRPLTEIEALVVDGEPASPVEGTHPTYYFGDGAMKCATVITADHARFVEGVVPDAQYMGLLVENGMGHRIEGTGIAYYDPMYLKEFIAAPSHVKGLGHLPRP